MTDQPAAETAEQPEPTPPSIADHCRRICAMVADKATQEHLPPVEELHALSLLQLSTAAMLAASAYHDARNAKRDAAATISKLAEVIKQSRAAPDDDGRNAPPPADRSEGPERDDTKRWRGA